MKEDTITLPLGFRFVVGNDIVEVQKGGLSCDGCAFFNRACLLPFPNIKCSAGLRSDEINVKFAIVGEASL